MRSSGRPIIVTLYLRKYRIINMNLLLSKIKLNNYYSSVTLSYYDNSF